MTGCVRTGGRRGLGGGARGERKARTYNEGMGHSPQQGQRPFLSGSPPVAERLFALSQPEESANLSRNLVFLQNKND